ESMAVCRQETFGPVVSVYPCEDDDEAVRLANDSEDGLNASVWSRNARHARAVAARIESGTGNIKGGYASAYGSPGAPRGGMKASGRARRQGAHGLPKSTDAQPVASQRIAVFAPPFGLSSQTYAKVLSRSLLLLKKAHIR